MGLPFAAASFTNFSDLVLSRPVLHRDHTLLADPESTAISTTSWPNYTVLISTSPQGVATSSILNITSIAISSRTRWIFRSHSTLLACLSSSRPEQFRHLIARQCSCTRRRTLHRFRRTLSTRPASMSPRVSTRSASSVLRPSISASTLSRLSPRSPSVPPRLSARSATILPTRSFPSVPRFKHPTSLLCIHLTAPVAARLALLQRFSLVTYHSDLFFSVSFSLFRVHDTHSPRPSAFSRFVPDTPAAGLPRDRSPTAPTCTTRKRNLRVASESCHHVFPRFFPVRDRECQLTHVFRNLQVHTPTLHSGHVLRPQLARSLHHDSTPVKPVTLRTNVAPSYPVYLANTLYNSLLAFCAHRLVHFHQPSVHLRGSSGLIALRVLLLRSSLLPGRCALPARLV